MTNKTLLFNPTSLVHDRNVDIFRKHLPGWNIRCIYNPRQPWFADMRKRGDGASFYFTKGHFPRPPREALKDVDAVILFTAQSRIPPANLIQEAVLRSIPVIAIEEVYMMMLEQGFINNYLLPVDHLFAASEYERARFIEIGTPARTIEATGCIFQYKSLTPVNPDEKGKVKRGLGLSPDKLTATLSLAFLNASNETLDVRRRLLEIVSGGLPEEYELLVKPHPSEDSRDLEKFVKRFAPNARIAGATLPIDKVLDVTSVLFNRGNSQTNIDALQRGIPVIPVPVGRRTFFHDMLNEIVVNDESDVKRVLDIVKERGMSIYEDVFKSHLSILPEDALKKVISRIREIAETKSTQRSGEKLLELALFWAWMGYPSQAARTLKLEKAASSSEELKMAVHKLISGKAQLEDVAFLRKWNKDRYMEWVIQSLWIKTLYDKNLKIPPESMEWLSGFPPEMNRAYFMPYAGLLSWCHRRKGLDLGDLPARFRNDIVLKLKDILWRLEMLRR